MARGTPRRTKARATQARTLSTDSLTDLLSALNHPIRRQILRLLHRHREALSPTLMQKPLNEHLGTVAYHVRILSEFGLTELVETKQRRGATEHFYRSVVTEIPTVISLLDLTEKDDTVTLKKRRKQARGAR